MAEKHKSKYKKPENTKYKTRKDLKDYTADDKEGGLNPNSTGNKQSNVLRKTDKEVVDTGDIYVKYNADDRLYKDVEEGDYDPKHAAKVLKKRQDKDEKDNEKNIKDKIENLTREQKERLVREYVRRKIAKVILEADEPTDPNAEAETPTEAPAPDATAAPTPDATATTATPAPEAEMTVTPDTTAAAAPDAAPATPTTPATPEDPETKEALAVEKFISHLQSEGGNISRIKSIAKVMNAVFKYADPEDQKNFFKMLRTFATKKLSLANPVNTDTAETKPSAE